MKIGLTTVVINCQSTTHIDVVKLAGTHITQVAVDVTCLTGGYFNRTDAGDLTSDMKMQETQS